MIEEIPLSSPFFHAKVEAFLTAQGLRMEPMDCYYASLGDDGNIVAGAGIAGDVLKCMAVLPEVRSEGLLAPLVSRLVADHPGRCLKVFTKPEYQPVFESLGFHLLASAPLAVLLENGRGLEEYCAYLRSQVVPGRCGVVVMNANPFTLGHRYLLASALKQVDHLYVIPVKEDASEFPYTERLAMIKSAVGPTASAGPAAMPTQADADKPACDRQEAITVLDGSSYIISAATFPTYFLKNLSDAAETQMQLDLDLFRRHIAPALGNPIRFVGSEPLDPLTARYNALMPEAIVVPRPEMASSRPAAEENYFSCGGSKNQFPSAIAMQTHEDAISTDVISASAVRTFLSAGRFREAAALCPKSSWPYLLAALAVRALRLELDTPGKPGLVGPDGSGAHKDMDYDTLLSGIKTLRPFWSRMALAENPEALQQLGIEAEEAMMAATGGVNTHRGAIFCFGLALYTVSRFSQMPHNENITHFPPSKKEERKVCIELIINTLRKTAQSLPIEGVKKREGIRGARWMALDGYRTLFEDWLPFYRSLAEEAPSEGASATYSATEGDAFSARQRLLLKIMSSLDDTCVIKRAGKERADEVKKEARELLEQFSEEKLKEMCTRYAQEGISPGGAADMLALTIFIDSII